MSISSSSWGGGCGDQLLQEGESSGGGLLGAVFTERAGLALCFVNEGSEPGREALGEGKIHTGHGFCA